MNYILDSSAFLMLWAKTMLKIMVKHLDFWAKKSPDQKIRAK
jgi:hypothetical protein